MQMLTTFFTIAIAMVTTMLATPIFLSKLMKKWSNKNSSFECGMNQSSMSRKPFSVRFFLLMILFIIFDIEVALIIAVPSLPQWPHHMMLFFITFMFVLTNGILYEWMDGALNWKM